jgi:hypothetical protein
MPNRSPLQKPEIVTTQTMHNSLMCGREYNYTIRTCAPISIAPKELSLDPYVLGAWLGDGKQDAGYLYSNDPFIVSEIERLGHPWKKTKRAYEYSFAGIATHLKKLNLLKNKHIPEQYLLAGNEQRLSLLQGLMDTDGTVSKIGDASFCNTNKDIAYGVKFLAESLGMRVSIKTKVPKCRGKECSLAYILTIVSNTQIFRLPRKAARLAPYLGKRKGDNRRTVVAIEPVPSIPVKCIGIEHESHLFLAGKSLVPTHNTETALFIATVAALLNPGFIIMIITPELKQGKKIYWTSGRIKNYPPRQYIAELGTTELKVVFTNGSIITIDGCENYDSLRGVKPNLVIYDEFQDHSKEFHLEVMQPNLLGKASALIIFGTPPKKRSAYYVQYREQLLKRIEREQKEGCRLAAYYEFPSSVNPSIDTRKLHQIRRELIESGNEVIWQREYEGRMAFGGEDVVFPKWNPSASGEAGHLRRHHVLMSYLEQDKSKLKWYTICDPGTSTCFAVLFACYNPFTQQIFIMDEIYEKDRKKTDSRQIWDRIRKKEDELYPGAPQTTWRRIYDEAAAWFHNEISALYRGQRVNLTPTKKYSSDKEMEISRVKMAMSQPGAFLVSDRCYWLRWEIESYITVLDKNGDAHYMDTNDHLLDCTFYLFNACGWTLLEKAEEVLLNQEMTLKRVETINPNEWADNVVEGSLYGDGINDIYPEFFN